MAARVDEGTRRTVNVSIVSLSLAILAGLHEVGWVVDRMQGTVVEKVEVKKEFDAEENRRPVLKIELACEGYERWSSWSRRRISCPCGRFGKGWEGIGPVQGRKCALKMP